MKKQFFIMPRPRVSLASKYPDLVAALWDYDNNVIKPDQISYGSAQEVNWHCKAGCGNHRFSLSPNAMTSGGKIRECPICSISGRVCPCGCNSIAVTHPDIVKVLWHPKNPYSPRDYRAGSNAVVWWRCQEGCGNHEWQTIVCHVIIGGTRCPCCANKLVCPCGCNSLASLYPDIAVQWDIINNDRGPDSVTPGSTYMASWRCFNGCGYHAWETTVSKRTGGDATGCPRCSNYSVCPCGCNSVAGNPAMMALWDPANTVKPWTVLAGSHSKYSWICPKGCGNHQWTTAAHNVRIGRGCHVCCGKKVCACLCNSLAMLRPDIVSMWSPVNTLSPYKLTQCSAKRVTLMCDRGHPDWSTSGQVVGVMGGGCRQCGYDSAAEKNRLTTDEFIARTQAKWPNALDYSMVEYKSCQEEVHLRCTAKGHNICLRPSWLLYKAQYPCGKCALDGNSRRFSKASFTWLQYMEVKHRQRIQHGRNGGEYKVPGTKFHADGYCSETRTIYEYHGDYWHGNPRCYPGETMNEVVKMTMGALYARTMCRETMLRDMGYTVVSIWEHDWNAFISVVKRVQHLWRSRRC